MTQRILIADDNKNIGHLLEDILVEEGYEVEIVYDGDALLTRAQADVPDLMLIDVQMPNVDGYEAIRQLRNDTRLAHVPMLLLTARSSVEDVVNGFEIGADDYITKPFNLPELLARIKAQLLRARRRPVQNPLTGLPGNTLIEEEVKHRLRFADPFALLYIDLDHFKAFNDSYGFARGDEVILLVARLLTELRDIGSGQIFIGHVGGDDYVVIVPLDLVEPFCTSLIAQFDQQVPALYDPEDARRGYLRQVDRFNAVRRFPIQTISIGVVRVEPGKFGSYGEISQVAAEMKHAAKKQTGSVFVVDQREPQPVAALDNERRGARRCVWVLGDDWVIKHELETALRTQDYEIMREPGGEEQCADGQIPDLVTLIASHPWATVAQIRARWPHVPVVVIAPDDNDQDEETVLSMGVQAFLRYPFPFKDYLALVTHLLRLEAR
jgi:DNA-binding response OmpR family regulator